MCPSELDSAQEHGKKVFAGGSICGHAGYHTGFQYVTEDTEVLRSENHLSSVAAPKTLPAVRKCTAKATSRKNARAARKRLTNLEASIINTSNGIDSKLHLLALAKKRKTDGDSRLYEFLLNRGEK